ncbi:MAG TPA: GNAT family N-acetyltransferase [Micromonospora sp.]|nr:GNAT family N-acetyltransferase [Micromonospora sp.]
MSEIELRFVPYDSPVAQQLVAAALVELAERYGGEGDETPVDPKEFEPPNGAFLVALLNGEPVGCAGWRSHGEDGDIAELKRMYTVPTARGRGVARTLLAAVERSAREHGRRRLVLESGDKQPEAIALYERCGYEQIEDFGFYRGSPSVRSYGRDL